MPSEQMNHECSDTKVENVVGRREASGYEDREDDQLEGSGGDGQQHGSAKTWAG